MREQDEKIGTGDVVRSDHALAQCIIRSRKRIDRFRETISVITFRRLSTDPGWFYTMFAEATALDRKIPFRTSSPMSYSGFGGQENVEVKRQTP